jgi:hypothetical protein|tara:strand:- start:1898 stop:3802 length:1905 start_codon:yes stop_codon:yes gene_type:complete
VSSDDELWNSGTNSEITEGNTDEDDALDLSSPSPEINEDLNLSNKEITEADDWAIPIIENDKGINIRAIGAIGVVVILLLTGTLFFLFTEQNIVVIVPFEKYEEQITYDIEGSINFESTIDIPLPLGFIDNDVVINELDIVFTGELSAGIKAPPIKIIDGYGNEKNVFKKYLEQNLNDIDGTIRQEGKTANNLENAQIITFQHQFIDTTSLEIIRTDIESNASYSDTITGDTWYWQGSTDWIPRDSEAGLLPHGDLYIGKTLKEGTKGTTEEGGIRFNWEVHDGGNIKGEQTVRLRISTAYSSEVILGYTYQYQYTFDLYLSEKSSLPLKFNLNLNSDASSPSGKLYSINLDYKGISSVIDEGYQTGEVPTTPYKDSSKQMTGVFSDWNNGAPALGTGDCNINSNFSLTTGIQKARNDINEFDSYIKDQIAKEEEAFVIEANYTARNGGKWNFTMAHNNEQAPDIDGWVLEYESSGEEENKTLTISGNRTTVDNPILTMEEIPTPLTICSAENVMTDFEEIADWAIDDQLKSVNYEKVTLLLGQNLVSKQSLSSPTSILDFGSLDLISIVSDLNRGNLNLNDYSNNIDVDTVGSYAYFLDKKGFDKKGNDYQQVAGVDAKDGLVLFNIQTINTT